MMNIIAIIQARMGSSRLPGKVLRQIDDKPMLQWVVERTARAAILDQVVVATTTDPGDDPVADFCAQQGYAFTRGSVYDVLDRYVQAARTFEANIIVRVTADCPLMDPELLDLTVRAMFEPDKPLSLSTVRSDFTANRLPPPWGRTLPIGLDVEAVTRTALEQAYSQAEAKHYREHVMPYFYDDLPPDALQAPDKPPGNPYYILRAATPRGYKAGLLNYKENLGSIRWTVDTAEDLAAVRALASFLPEDFTWLDALSAWQIHPELARINAQVQHKNAGDLDERA